MYIKDHVQTYLSRPIMECRIISILPAGHVPVLQLCCSEERPLHAVPPFSACVSTFLVLTCTPPPHVLLHVAHVSHVPHAQFTEVYIIDRITVLLSYKNCPDSKIIYKRVHDKIIPAGHVPALQSCCSVERPEQAVPPFSS